MFVIYMETYWTRKRPHVLWFSFAFEGYFGSGAQKNLIIPLQITEVLGSKLGSEH